MQGKIDLVTLEKGLRADFMKGFNNGEDPSEIKPFIMETTSSSNKEKYGWLGDSPSLTEWVDERKLHNLLDFDYEIVNKDYEASIVVKRNDILDDQMGAIKIRIQDLARKAKIHPRGLFFELLVKGSVDECYDGQAFFSASHEEGKSGVQSNIVAGGGITLALLKADYYKAIARMKGFKDSRNEPFYEGNQDLTIVCSESLEHLFDELASSAVIDSSDNALKGKFKVISSSRFTAKNEWYISNNAGTMKPIIRQNRQAPQFQSQEGESNNGFMRKEFAYGIDYRMGMGYGMWQFMVKVVNA